MPWPTNPSAPNLDALNGGQECTGATPVTQDIFNAIVQALIYLHNIIT